MTVQYGAVGRTPSAALRRLPRFCVTRTGSNHGDDLLETLPLSAFLVETNR